MKAIEILFRLNGKQYEENVYEGIETLKKNENKIDTLIDIYCKEYNEDKSKGYEVIGDVYEFIVEENDYEMVEINLYENRLKEREQA